MQNLNIDYIITFLKKFWYVTFSMLINVIVIVGTFLYVNSNNNECPECEICSTNIKSKIDDTENKIKVDIKGAVQNPNVYEIEEGSSVDDAIKLAGGITKNATTENINLSKKLSDEMVIYVFTKKELEEQKSTNKLVCELPKCECEQIVINECLDENTGSEKILINTASLEELMKLDGIGESKAKAIIDYREKEGSFTNIEDIKKVSGIGDAAFNKIKDKIAV